MRKKRESSEDESEDSCTDDVVGMNGLDPCNQNPTATHITSIQNAKEYQKVDTATLVKAAKEYQKVNHVTSVKPVTITFGISLFS